MRFENNESDENLGPLDYSALDTVDDYFQVLKLMELDIEGLDVKNTFEVKAVKEDLKHITDALQKNRKFPAIDRLPPGDRTDVELELKKIRTLFRDKVKLAKG